jgi:hypothetical protein
LNVGIENDYHPHIALPRLVDHPSGQIRPSQLDGIRTMCDQCQQKQPPIPGDASRRRRRLWEIKPHYHCAILGSCLSMDELRKTVRQSGLGLQRDPTDYDLHALMVNQAEQQGRPSKCLQKMLDAKYRRWIQTLGKCREPEELAKHWQTALVSGEIAGPFWAIMSHPQADTGLLSRVYEDMHMLSHLQGASNRAELKRLRRLEHETAELRERLDKTRQRHRQELEMRDSMIRQQALELAASAIPEAADDTATATQALEELRRQNQALAKRLDWTEDQLAERDMRLARLHEERRGLQELLDETREEHRAIEESLQRLLAGHNPGDDPAQANLDLSGKRVLYVGGQTRLAPHLRSLVEAHNGRFTHHDGGIEESRANLQCALAGADLVFCPVDCISHDACLRAKQHCRQQNKRFIPLRSSGLSAFAAGLQQSAGNPYETQSTPLNG